MNEVADRYYRATGAVPFVGTMLMLGIGLVAAVVLSFVYALIDHYNPFVYFTALATFGLGVGCGWAVKYGARLGKVRNTFFCSLVGAVIGLTAAYFSWVWYLVAIFDFQGFTLDPLMILAVMQGIAAAGAWSIFGVTPTGWGLYSIWMLEAGIIVYFATRRAGDFANPYCEYCGLWTKDRTLDWSLKTTDAAVLRRELEEERYEALDALRGQAADPGDCLRIRLDACPHCQDSNYVTLSRVVTTVNSKGNVETTSTDVVRYLRIDTELWDELSNATAPQTSDAGDDEKSEGAVADGKTSQPGGSEPS